MKFQLGTNVKVIEGFFKGKAGPVTDFCGTKIRSSDGKILFIDVEYLLHFNKRRIWISEEYLEERRK